jgi:hypothetical protein
MLGPRIESLGIQRRRAVYAHQGALLAHRSGSLACDLVTPLIHVKAAIATSRRCTHVSSASNEGAASITTNCDGRAFALRLVKRVPAPLLR